MQLRIEKGSCPEELRPGLEEIEAEYPHRFRGPGARTVVFARDPARAAGGLRVAPEGERLVVRYGRKTDAFRALGRLLGAEGAAAFDEVPRFDLLGAMVDVSRNGVVEPQAARALLRRLALMGLNMMILYAEDTYEVPGEPFFGYLRGRYTADEMRALDRYAELFGIEMFPCIQALAHLEQVLKWPAYAAYRDTGGIFLAGEERTYQLLDKMIAAASTPFRSKRIHVGMDEAHGIGSGRYRQLHGERRSFDILNEHLARVRDLCRARGLKPMIWSDMYFRLGSKHEDYYDRACVIPPDVVARIPKDVELVYWDYYHTEQEFYEDWIERHRALGSEPLMAGGVWTWNHLWAALPFSFTTSEACLRACKAKKLRQAFATLWGDDGMECDLFSALPGLQFFAEHGYADEVDPNLLRANFRGACDADFDDFLKASELDSVPLLERPAHSCTNVSKWLLWQDPFLAPLDPQVGKSLRSHYTALGKHLDRAARASGGAQRLAFPAAVARVLALKCDLRRELAAAYKAGNRRRLKALAQGDLKQLRREVDRLWRVHRAMWLATYKPFGLEVIESRYGGLRARLESLSDRLRDYLKGDVESIPELETKLEQIHRAGPGDLPNLDYRWCATGSCIR